MNRNATIFLSIVAVLIMVGVQLSNYFNVRAYEKCLEVQKDGCKCAQ
jgi:hypothetical protein